MCASEQTGRLRGHRMILHRHLSAASPLMLTLHENPMANSKPDFSKPKIRSAILLVLGTIALGAGCYFGFIQHGKPVLVLGIYGVSIALFVAEIAISLYWRVHLKLVIPVALPAPAAKVKLDSHSELASSEGRQQPGVTLLEAAAKSPASTVDSKPVQASSIAHIQSQANPEVQSTPAMKERLDVALLMQAPLADLLLAALCKDADGARRIFKQAISQYELPLNGVGTQAAGVDVESGLHPTLK